jgi:hypothetical protein
MIRRFNYTGRRPLSPKCVQIDLNEGPPRTLDAKFDLADEKLPPKSRIILEVTSRGFPNTLRFNGGTVEAPRALKGESLEEVQGERLLITLKVVEAKEDVGRILGISRDLLRGGGGDDHPLLPVNPVDDLGHRIWRLNFQDAEEHPRLDVNKAIEGIKEHVRTDPRFFALVFPQVIQGVLERILIEDQLDDPDGSLSDWRVQWLQWAIFWHPDHSRPPGFEQDGKEAIRGWIDEVVGEFCAQHQVLESYRKDAFGEELS